MKAKIFYLALAVAMVFSFAAVAIVPAEPAMAETIMAALRRITGLSLSSDVQVWRQWWREKSGE